jgi:FKBP-type peptidyl-prolyl cis-trans isomerase
MKNHFRFFSFVALMAIVASCSKYPGFKKSDNGLFYKFHVEAGDTARPKVNDVLQINLSYYTMKEDAVDTLIMKPTAMPFQLMAPFFKGDLMEGLAMMGKGDSATFIVQADSFFTKFVRQPRPNFIDSNSVLYFDVKMNDFMSMEQMMKKREEENAQKRVAEAEIIKKYVADNNITVQPTESGLYVIETLKGKGPKPAAGQKVKVHYTGMLLDGTKFDSSLDRGQPFEFTLGQNEVIKGWDEAIALLTKGSKARLIIPSSIGYGERGAGQVIPPFATLIFEVELIDIVK